jgi:membrane protease YdiL (CAAX protease family)
MHKIINKIFYSDSRIRLFWPIIFIIITIALGEFLVVDPIGKLLSFFGLYEPQTSNAQEWSPAIYEFLKRSARSLIVVLAIWLSIKFLMKKPFSFVGFTFNKGWFPRLFIGVFLGFVIQAVALILMVLFGWYIIEGFLWDFMSLDALISSLLFAFIISAEIGILEEFIFRGFLMNSLIDRYNAKIGVLASSILFGLLHFSGSANEFPWWLSIISATICGFLFAQAYLLFNNIWMPLGLHFAWHFASRILGTTGVTPDEACFLVTNVDGPTLLVATKSGGASLFELIGVGICSLIIFLIKKKGSFSFKTSL